MSCPEGVSINVTDGVCKICFAHPKANCFSSSLLSELASAIQSVSANVIILESAGQGAFSAGASFEEFKQLKDLETACSFFQGFGKLIKAMVDAPQFIVAKVQGKAVGGGVGIVAASDYVIANTDAAIKLSELDLGIGPFVIAPVLKFKLGLSAFSALSIDRSWYDAAWALDKGIFTRLAEEKDLDSSVSSLAQELVGLSPEAMKALKKVQWSDFRYDSQDIEDLAEKSAKLLLKL